MRPPGAECDLLQGRPRSALARLDDFYADEAVNLAVRTTTIEVFLATGDLDRADIFLIFMP